MTEPVVVRFRGATGDSFEAYLREEAAAAERFTAGVRLAILLIVLAFNLLLGLFSEGVRASIPVLLTFSAVGGAYTVGIFVLARRTYHPALSYVTLAIDVAFAGALTLALSITAGSIELATKIPAALSFFLLIALAGLRLSAPLVLFASGLGAVAYLSLLVPVAITQPGRLTLELNDLDGSAVSITRSLLVALLLVVTGLVTAVMASRARDLVRRSLHTLTFLYADLRGFTAFIESLGDAAGAELVTEYRRLVRAEIARAGGRELKTEGDSFLVEFRTARQALQCATGILVTAARRCQERADLPLLIGIGLHAGEPVRLEQDYIGSAVNLTARLGQAAEAGELLASDVVRGLLRTSGAPPTSEREGLVLKGIADPPRVYAFEWQATTA